MERRVVVTGYGAVSPVGVGVPSFWDALIKGKSGITRITQFDPERFDSKIAGEAKDFVTPSFILPKDVRRTPRFVQFALKACEEAILQSKLDLKNIDPYRTGVIIGSGIGCLQIVESECFKYLQKGPDKISPFLIPSLITNEAAGAVAIHFGLKGINFCTVTACASGAHAIGEAYSAVKYGRADVIVCGGAEASVTPMGVGGFCALKALSKRNDEPQRACRPFDRDRDGFIMAEGSGVIVLEEYEHAKKRNAPIFAEVGGYGATCDAYHITAPDPEAIGPAKAMEFALAEAGIGISGDIYINAHGTSTQLNDATETLAVKRVFGDLAKEVSISSTKSMTGHMLGAAGAVEFIVACLVVKNKIIPPTVNYENPDPVCDLDYTPNKARERNVKVAISNSLGFGGHNASLLVKEFK
ncbi:MAG: beta-ketoacyl-ACP synthase II [Candidatus Omnitrophica bacterium]|jgi:3-oxoacyl-[acyl-carrier-protein] synthase II|nr:beta-ketoacyl-ACP synthase II [Candidatus Omnitrophota bacterium]